MLQLGITIINVITNITTMYNNYYNSVLQLLM